MIISNNEHGGLPVGKLTTIVGQQGSGKTLIAIMAAKDVIRKDGIVVWIDTQNSLDLMFLQSFGIPRDKVIYIQLNTVQAMFQIMDDIAKQIRRKNSNKLLLFVVDSIAGLSTKPEVQGAVGDANYGIAARLLSQGLRKHIINFGKLRSCLLFTNQLRYSMKSSLFEDPLSAMYGGKAIPYYSSIMLKLRKAAKLKNGDQVIGNQISVTVQKNRLAPPYRKTRFECIYDHGVSQISQILEDLKGLQIVKVSGAWYTWSAGPLKDQKFQKKNFPQMFHKKQVNDFIWKLIAQKYILDIDRIIDADGLSSQSQIVEQIVTPTEKKEQQLK